LAGFQVIIYGRFWVFTEGCSAAEALERQHPFINQTLANHALALLSRLFRCEPMAYHGGFLNLTSGALVALRAEPKVWKRMRRRLRRD